MRVARLKETYPTAKVELWCEDEHRPGLKSRSSAGCGAPSEKGREFRPTSVTSGPTPLRLRAPENRRGPLVDPPHGEAEAFSMALENFAREVGAGKGKRVLLVLDRAGWHTAKKKLKVPEGIHLEFLPSHSPELQPSERLWPLSNEGVANRYFEEIEELEEALVERCVALGDQPEVIRSYTRYHWWPEAA